MAIILSPAAAGVLRDNHWVKDPVSGQMVRTTLVEGPRTNEWSYSEDLTQAVWVRPGAHVTVTPDAHTAPDGTASMDKAVEAATTGIHEIQRHIPAANIADNSINTFSFHAKAGERRYIRIYFRLKSNISRPGGGCLLDLQTGAITNVGGIPDNYSVRVVYAGNGVYRYSFTLNVGAGSTDVIMYWRFDQTGADVVNYTGDGTSGFFLWGIQWEKDAFSESAYIPTTTTSVTRGGDILKAPFAYLPREMTVLVDYYEMGGLFVPTGTPRLLQIGNDDNSPPRFLLYANNAGAGGSVVPRLYVMNDVSGQLTTTFVDLTGVKIGDRVRALATLRQDGAVDLSARVNDGAVVTATRGSAVGLAPKWSAGSMTIGSHNNGLLPYHLALRSLKLDHGARDLTYMEALAA